jgi:hypothetical protein
MSDQSQGPGWWIASDGRWYPPEQAPDAAPLSGHAPPASGYAPPVAPGPVPTVAPPPKRRRTGLIIGLAALVVVVAMAAVVLLSVSGDDVEDIDTSAFEPQTFDDAEALVDELGAQGVDCEGFEETEPSDAILELNVPESSGECTIDDTVVLVDVYADEDESQENLDRLVELSRDCDFAPEADGESDIASGANWQVGVQSDVFGADEGQGAVVDEVAEVLFGETVDFGCEE